MKFITGGSYGFHGVPCQCCHKTMYHKRSDAKYCSAACKQRMYRAGLKQEIFITDRKSSVTDKGAASRNASMLIGVHGVSNDTKFLGRSPLKAREDGA